MTGAHRFIESRIKVADGNRGALQIDDAKRTPLRNELQTVLGVVEERLPTRLEQFGDANNPALVSESEMARVYQVRWPVIANVFGEGRWIQQKENARGCCVVVPDADQSPEQLLGLAEGLPPEKQIAAKLAAQGLDLLIPAIIQTKLAQNKVGIVGYGEGSLLALHAAAIDPRDRRNADQRLLQHQ